MPLKAVSSSAGGSGGTGATVTGTPSNGNLAAFSGASSITNTDLSGDITTSGAAVTTVAKIAGTTVSGTTGTGNVAFSASPTFTGTLAAAAITATGETITSTSTTALAVGANGATNPVLSVNAAAGSVATGLAVQGLGAGGGVNLNVSSSATDESLLISPKGAGIVSVSNYLRVLGATPYAIIQFGQTSITPGSDFSANPRFVFTNPTSTFLSAGNENNFFLVDLSASIQHNTGAIATQRDSRIKNCTHSAVAASTITNCATFSLDGPPIGSTNITLTNAHGIYIPTQALANTTNGYGITINAPTGATTNNYAAQFVGGPIAVAGVIDSFNTRVSTQFDKTTDTTLANITGLTATLVAGKTYSFRAVLHLTPDTVGGQKIAMAGTCTATAIIAQVNSINNTTNANILNSRLTSLGSSAGVAGGTTDFTTIDGLITVNGAGTLTVQFAQTASNGTSSVLVGSTFIVTQII